MDTLRSTLVELIRTLPPHSDESACLAWTLVAGPMIAERTRAERLHRKALVVSVCDEAWRQQLQAMKRELTARLQEILGEEGISDIEFRVQAPGSGA